MQITQADAGAAATVARIVAESNKDVAERFGLTAGNCPKHPSHCTTDWVLADLARGERYFVAVDDAQPIACVAYERAAADLAYLNRLSVLPAWRRRGVGERLVRRIVELARADGVAAISIGVIAEHDALQRWYRKLGFVDGEVRTYPHLPFAVKYMSYPLAGSVDPLPGIGADAPHTYGD